MGHEAPLAPSPRAVTLKPTASVLEQSALHTKQLRLRRDPLRRSSSQIERQTGSGTTVAGGHPLSLSHRYHGETDCAPTLLGHQEGAMGCCVGGSRLRGHAGKAALIPSRSKSRVAGAWP